MSSAVLAIEPTYTMENLIETKMLRFRVNGKVDKRCKAFKRNIVDVDGNFISATNETTTEVEVEVETEVEVEKFAEEVKKFDETEESPPDDWFYGKLDEPVKDKECLTDLMVTGIKRFKNYMEISSIQEDCAIDELDSTLDLWVEHDSLRKNHFKNLVNEDEFDEFYANVISQAFKN